MSAIRPNRNFDNETTTHTPYSEIVKQRVTRSQEYIGITPSIRTNTLSNKKPDIRDSQSVRSVYNRFFNG